MGLRLAIALVLLAILVSMLVSVYEQLEVLREVVVEDFLLSYEERTASLVLEIAISNYAAKPLDVYILGVSLDYCDSPLAILRDGVRVYVEPGSATTLRLPLTPLVPQHEALEALKRGVCPLEVELEVGIPAKVFGFTVLKLPVTIKATKA